MKKHDLCEVTIAEVVTIIKVAADGLARHNMQAASAMRGSADALFKRKTEIADTIVEKVGGESPDFSRLVSAASAVLREQSAANLSELQKALTSE